MIMMMMMMMIIIIIIIVIILEASLGSLSSVRANFILLLTAYQLQIWFLKAMIWAEVDNRLLTVKQIFP
jgi:hypothetical protein